MCRVFRFAAAVAATAHCLPRTSTLADGTAASRLSSASFTTIDLTPDDGVAAGYTIDGFFTGLVRYFASIGYVEQATLAPATCPSS